MSKLKRLAAEEKKQREEAKQDPNETAVESPRGRGAQFHFLSELSPDGPTKTTLPREGGGEIIHADPEKCRPWKLHDRDTELTDQAYIDELASLIERHGQRIPALGRFANGKDDSDGIEIIYGVRRWLACMKLGRSLILEIRRVAERDALVEMELENRRLDLSIWERGRSYQRWIEKGEYKSIRDLAKVIEVDQSQLTKMVKIGTLPRELLKPLVAINDVGYRSGLKLFSVWSNLDPKGQGGLLKKLSGLDGALKPDELISLIDDYASGKSKKPNASKSTAKSDKVLVKKTEKNVTITLPRSGANAELIKKLLDLVEKIDSNTEPS